MERCRCGTVGDEAPKAPSGAGTGHEEEGEDEAGDAEGGEDGLHLAERHVDRELTRALAGSRACA